MSVNAPSHVCFVILFHELRDKAVSVRKSLYFCSCHTKDFLFTVGAISTAKHLRIISGCVVILSQGSTENQLKQNHIDRVVFAKQHREANARHQSNVVAE
jgi:hypothetical protein